MRVTLVMYTGDGPETLHAEVEVPALPRIGDWVAHDKSGVSGFVKEVLFWWEQDATEPVIEVRLK